MASKTRMYELLRLLESSADPAIEKAALECWQQLPADVREQMSYRSRNADCRRARIWAAAYNGAQQEALDRIQMMYQALAEDLEQAGISVEPPALEWLDDALYDDQSVGVAI